MVVDCDVEGGLDVCVKEGCAGGGAFGDVSRSVMDSCEKEGGGGDEYELLGLEVPRHDAIFLEVFSGFG